MTLSKGTIPQRVAETLISDTVANATPVQDAFSGITLATKIYAIKLDNSGVNAVSYFKGQISSGAQYATGTAPDIRLYAPANTIVEYTFPSGWPANSFSGSDKFHFLGTSTDASTGTQADPSGNGSFKVTILGGT